MISRPTIPLKGSVEGRQYAGWQPGTFAMTGLGNRVLASQSVPVGDGITLNADVYTPAKPGRFPAVVSFGGYSTELHTAGVPAGSNEVGSPPVFTDRGYCPVIVERRGMGRSTGEPTVFFDPQDVDDHAAVIAWAAEQPWCNGDVVLFGTSYYGMTQPLVAARKPPALRAFFANEICTDFYRHLIQFGGVPASFFLALWMGANFTEKVEDLRMPPNARALISRLTNGPLHPVMEKMMHKNVDRMFASFMAATPMEWAREIYVQWTFDQKSRAEARISDGSTAVLGNIDVPFAVVQNLGYFNLHQFGSYDLFENAGTPPERKWMILSPPAYDLPVYSWEGEALAFFDHILRGTDNGYDQQAPVRYWVEGDATFATAATFPPSDSRPRRLHLADGRLDVQMPTGGTASWVAVPRGVPLLGGLDATAPQVIAFDLAVSEDSDLAGVVLAGPVTAHLSFSCNEIDSYVVASLSRVDAAGESHLLSLGAIRPAARTEEPARHTAVEIVLDTGRREPLTPGEPVQLHFSLTPAPSRLRAGDVLRFELASRTDLLRSDPAHGHAQFDLPVPPFLCRNTIHCGTDSWIEVTMVRDA